MYERGWIIDTPLHLSLDYVASSWPERNDPERYDIRIRFFGRSGSAEMVVLRASRAVPSVKRAIIIKALSKRLGIPSQCLRLQNTPERVENVQQIPYITATINTRGRGGAKPKVNQFLGTKFSVKI